MTYRVLLATLFCFLGVTSEAQKEVQIPPFEIIDGQPNYYYEETVNLDSNITKQEIHQVLKIYLVSHFRSESNVIQLDDSANGILIARVYTKLPISVGMGMVKIHNDKIHYTLTIKIKDGKYKYRLDNFTRAYTILKHVPGTTHTPGHTESTDYDEPLNYYNPERFKSKKRKRRATQTLQLVHIYISKEIIDLKMTLSSRTKEEDW